MRRYIVFAAAVLSLFTMATTPGGAAVRSVGRVKCRAMSGEVGPNFGTFQLDQCTAAATGGAGSATLIGPTSRGTAYLVTWAARQTTTLILRGTTASTVPGCPSGTAYEYNLGGKVTADTTGSIPVGQRLSAVICMGLGRYAPISIPAGSTFKL